jgi:ankyrin repeat protein
MCRDPRVLIPGEELNHPIYLLHAAIANQCSEVVTELLQSPDAGTTILAPHVVAGFPIDLSLGFLAGASGNAQIVKAILSCTFRKLDPQISWRERMLRGAIRSGNLEAIHLILDLLWGQIQLTKPNAPFGPLHLCRGIAVSKHVDFCFQAHKLVEKELGDHAHAHYPDVNTVLDMMASRSYGRVDVADFLLNSPQFRHTEKNYRRLLSKAVYGGNIGIVRHLLARGAAPDGDGDDTLCLASRAGRMDIVRVLVEAGADVNQIPKHWAKWRFKKSPGPIINAILLEHEEMAQYLLAHGASLDVPYEGETHLTIAAAQGLETMARFLIQQGQRVDRAAVAAAERNRHSHLAEMLKPLVGHNVEALERTVGWLRG